MPLFFLAVFVLIHTNIYSRTIDVPNEVDTVYDAVMVAENGDLILLTQPCVLWTKPAGSVWDSSGGVIIKNKSITIEGTDPKSPTCISGDKRHFIIQRDSVDDIRYTFMYTEDTNVTLRNLALDSPLTYIDESVGSIWLPSPVIVQGGSLVIENCNIACPMKISGDFVSVNSLFTVQTYATYEPYGSHTLDIPGIMINNASGVQVEIIHTIINASHQLGFQALHISNVHNSLFLITNSQILGGTFTPPPRYGISSRSPYPGSSGIQIEDCNNLTIELTGSILTGGNGMGGYETKEKQIAASGGDGFSIKRSSVTVKNGTFKGGVGYEGYPLPWTDPHGNYPMIVPGGNGGHGIALYDSTAVAHNFQAEGGSGAVGKNFVEGLHIPAGIDGLPIYADTFSSFINFSPVLDWNLF